MQRFSSSNGAARKGTDADARDAHAVSKALRGGAGDSGDAPMAKNGQAGIAPRPVHYDFELEAALRWERIMATARGVASRLTRT